MQPIIRTKAGKEFSTMKVQNIESPKTQSGELKVKMVSSRINPVDMDLMKGLLPFLDTKIYKLVVLMVLVLCWKLDKMQKIFQWAIKLFFTDCSATLELGQKKLPFHQIIVLKSRPTLMLRKQERLHCHCSQLMIA
ncbi:MAG: hypothetical protein IPF62_12190 [Bacteroidetes bacterium]|nr:hypothetical protein [Bacteroidota bacterium]